VAVVDSGVDNSHPVLSGSVLPGADFSDSDTISNGDGHKDLDGHGTGMASLIVGHGRIVGAAPDAKILPIRVAGSAQRTNFAQGIRWATTHGADIISISSGAALADPREMAAVEEAIQSNVVVVAGVGNIPGSNSVQYPASYPGVIAVAATTRDGSHSSHSVTGPQVMLAAPGEHISRADLNHGFALATGTSDSTALVSGVVALILSKFPSLSVDEVTRRLTETAVDGGPVGRDETFGFGTVNPVDALIAQLPDHSPSVMGSSATNQQSATSRPGLPSSGWTPSVLSYGGVLMLILLTVVGVVVVTVAVIRARTQ